MGPVLPSERLRCEHLRPGNVRTAVDLSRLERVVVRLHFGSFTNSPSLRVWVGTAPTETTRGPVTDAPAPSLPWRVVRVIFLHTFTGTRE